MTIADLERHALELAQQLKITVRYWHGDEQARARAFVESRTIDVERIVDETTYAVFLHECGHCETDAAARPLGKDFIVGRVLYNSAGESRAWKWARAHALIWTAPMQTELRRGLRCSVKYAAHGLADPLWEELDRIGGRLTLGFAFHQQSHVSREQFAEKQRLVSQWRSEANRGRLSLEAARAQLAQLR